MLGLTGSLLALVWNRFYYGNDDLLQFTVARDHGLSWETLTLNVFQHVGPYNRAAHLLVYKLTDLSPVVGLAFVGLNALALLAACLWLMTELRLSVGRRVVGLVMIGLSVSLSESAVWFDAAMHVLPAIAVTIAICAAHVRGVRTGRRRWHVAAVVLMVLGQLTQERPVLALPLVVLVDFLLVWRLLPWRERFRRLWGLRWPLLALTVVAGAIAAWLRAYVVLEQLPVPDVPTTLRAMLSALTNYVLPSLLNLPLADPAPTAVQYAVLGVLVVVGTVVALVHRGNAGPVLFAAAVFLLYYGFLKASPLLNEDTITANAERLTNAAYVTVPAVIGLVHLRLPDRFSKGRLSPRGRRLTVAAVALALAAFLTLTNHLYLDRRWEQAGEARAYLDAVRASAPQWADPDVTLVPLSAHPAIGVGWSAPFLRHDVMLGLVSKGFESGDIGPWLVLIDHTGDVRPAALDTVGLVSPPPGDCIPSDAATPVEGVLGLRPAVNRGPLLLQLTYVASQDMDVRLSARRGGLGWHENNLASPLHEGRHTTLLPVDAPSADALHLRALTTGRVCVESATLVRPVIVGDDGVCRVVDLHGRPRGRTLCP